MAVKLDLPVETLFYLDLEEEEGQESDRTFVKVRQARQRDAERRAKLGENAITRVYKKDTDEEEVKQKWNMEEFKRIETYMTLTDCNILASNSVPEKPTYLFRFTVSGHHGLAMTEQEFNDVWGSLPSKWADVIYEKVLEMNPQWDQKKAT